MERADAMKSATQHHIRLGGRRVAYRVVRSRTARKLRLRVGPNGVEVVRPAARKSNEVAAFMDRNAIWILAQLKRVKRLRGLRRSEQRRVGEILYRGEPTQVRGETTGTRARGDRVAFG